MCASVNLCNACINGRYTTDLIDLYLYAIDNLRDKLSNNNCFTLPECRSNFSQSPNCLLLLIIVEKTFARKCQIPTLLVLFFSYFTNQTIQICLISLIKHIS